MPKTLIAFLLPAALAFGGVWWFTRPASPTAKPADEDVEAPPETPPAETPPAEIGPDLDGTGPTEAERARREKARREREAQAAKERLTTELGAGDVQRRVKALETLAAQGAEGLPHLEAAFPSLGHAVEAVREAAIAAFKALGPKAVAPTVDLLAAAIPATGHPMQTEHNAATLTLLDHWGSLAAEPMLPHLHEERTAFWAEVHLSTRIAGIRGRTLAGVLDELIHEVERGEGKARLAAVRLLRITGPDRIRALPALGMLLHDTWKDARLAALSTITAMGPDAATLRADLQRRLDDLPAHAGAERGALERALQATTPRE